jgi:hypothetical protein
MQAGTYDVIEEINGIPVRVRKGGNPMAALMSAIRKAEEAGNWGAVFGCLRINGKTIEAWCRERRDEAILGELAAIRERLEAARVHERIHGVGSLKVKDHPLNLVLAGCHEPGRPYLVTTADYLSDNPA